jgi:hypothetical protein
MESKKLEEAPMLPRVAEEYLVRAESGQVDLHVQQQRARASTDSGNDSHHDSDSESEGNGDAAPQLPKPLAVNLETDYARSVLERRAKIDPTEKLYISPVQAREHLVCPSPLARRPPRPYRSRAATKDEGV